MIEPTPFFDSSCVALPPSTGTRSGQSHQGENKSNDGEHGYAPCAAYSGATVAEYRAATTLADIAYAVTIRIGLIRIDQQLTVVAGIAYAVTVLISLVGVRNVWTVVTGVDHAVSVTVAVGFTLVCDPILIAVRVEASSCAVARIARIGTVIDFLSIRAAIPVGVRQGRVGRYGANIVGGSKATIIDFPHVRNPISVRIVAVRRVPFVFATEVFSTNFRGLSDDDRWVTLSLWAHDEAIVISPLIVRLGIVRRTARSTRALVALEPHDIAVCGRGTRMAHFAATYLRFGCGRVVARTVSPREKAQSVIAGQPVHPRCVPTGGKHIERAVQIRVRRIEHHLRLHLAGRIVS
jgi:hypothetical protein